MTDGELDRPDPEDDPFACSLCGCYLDSLKRVKGEEYCDGCQREFLPSPAQGQCIECGQWGPAEQMQAIDVSPESEYYPEIEHLCRGCGAEPGGER